MHGYSWKNLTLQGQEHKQYKCVKSFRVLNKGGLTIADYMLKIKFLFDKLEVVDCALTEEQKVMTILGGLDEQYYSDELEAIDCAFIVRMMYEKVKVEDAKALLLSQENRIERRKITPMSPLPIVNLIRLGSHSSGNNPQTQSSTQQTHVKNNTVGSQNASQTVNSF